MCWGWREFRCSQSLRGSRTDCQLQGHHLTVKVFAKDAEKALKEKLGASQCERGITDSILDPEGNPRGMREVGSISLLVSLGWRRFLFPAGDCGLFSGHTVPMVFFGSGQVLLRGLQVLRMDHWTNVGGLLSGRWTSPRVQKHLSSLLLVACMD